MILYLLFMMGLITGYFLAALMVASRDVDDQ